MNRFWTCHWQFRYWRPDINQEGRPVCSSGSNSFRKRGVSVGDSVYIVSLSAGQLYLGGRMVVQRIASRAEAVRLWNNDNLYDAEEWIVDSKESGTLLHWTASSSFRISCREPARSSRSRRSRFGPAGRPRTGLSSSSPMKFRAGRSTPTQHGAALAGSVGLRFAHQSQEEEGTGRAF